MTVEEEAKFIYSGTGNSVIAMIQRKKGRLQYSGRRGMDWMS